MPPSIFQRPGRRQITQPVGDIVAGPQFVRTWTELTQALARCDAQFSSNPEFNPIAPSLGAEIVICRAIAIPSPIRLTAAHGGLRLRALGRLTPLIASSMLDQLFLIDAPAVGFFSLYIIGASPSAYPLTAFEIDAANASGAAGNSCIVRDCVVSSDRLWVDEVGAIDASIEGNTHDRVDSTGPTVEMAARGRLAGNTLDNVASGPLIYVTGGAGSRITDNFCDGGEIDTASSAGANAIHGNTGTPTFNSHATDAIGLNT